MLLDRALEIVTLFAWALLALIVGTSFVLRFQREGPEAAVRKVVSRLSVFMLAVALAVTVASHGVVFIEPQEVGVVVSLLAPEGVRDRPFRGGLRFITPALEQVQRYPIHWQTYTMSGRPQEGEWNGDDSISARTSDGQEVSIDCSIIFQIDPEQAIRVHVDWQNRYIDDFVRPVTRGVIRTLVSQYQAEEVNSSRRKDLEREIDRAVRAALQDKGFVLDRFILRNISFSAEFSESIEQKQVAEQGVMESQHRAEQIRTIAAGEADRIRLKAEAEAEAIRIRAEAEAEALQAINAALSENDRLLTYRYIEKLSPNIRVMLVPGDAPYLLPLPALDEAEAAASPTAEATPFEEAASSEEIAVPTVTATPTP